MGWNEASMEKEALSKSLKAAQEKVKSLTAELGKMSTDLTTVKSNLGSVLNTIFEYGGAELLDRCEKYLVQN